MPAQPPPYDSASQDRFGGSQHHSQGVPTGNRECQQRHCSFSANKDQAKGWFLQCQQNYSSSPSFSCLCLYFQYYAEVLFHIFGKAAFSHLSLVG